MILRSHPAFTRVTTLAACLAGLLCINPSQTRAEPATTEPATTEPAKGREEVWTQQQAEAEVKKSVEGSPSIGKRNVRDLIRFSVDNGYLTLNSPITDFEDMRQVDVESLPGISTIEFRTTGGQLPLRFPQFKNWKVTPALLFLTDVLSSPNGNLQVVYASEGPLGSRQVELLQSPVVDEKDYVRLLISTSSDLLPAPVAGDMKLSAPSWVEFLRRYPRESAENLRPIFRQLGAEEDVFAVNLNEAWQVLASQWTEPAGLRDQVKAVLAKIDADDFHARQTAAKELQALGQQGAMVLATIDHQTLSPEQSSRVDALLKTLQPLAPDVAEKMSNNADYLINLLYTDDANLTRAALKRLRDVTHKEIPFDETTTADARKQAVDALWSSTAPPATAPAGGVTK